MDFFYKRTLAPLGPSVIVYSNNLSNYYQKTDLKKKSWDFRGDCGIFFLLRYFFSSAGHMSRALGSVMVIFLGRRKKSEVLTGRLFMSWELFVQVCHGQISAVTEVPAFLWRTLFPSWLFFENDQGFWIILGRKKTPLLTLVHLPAMIG